MTQAVRNIFTHSKQSVTRRAALTGAAAIALGVPTAAAALAPNPDAELIALGKEMERLNAMMAEARTRAKPNVDAWHREMAVFKQLNRHVPNSEYEAAWARCDAKYPIAFPTPDDVSDMMHEPSRRIMALPAATFAGLAVKARLYQLECDDLWGKPEDALDWDDKVAKSLADAVLRLAVQA